jgi:tetratricopeptide (TPR) repeat protein
VPYSKVDLSADSLQKAPILKILTEIGLYGIHKGKVAKARELFASLETAVPALPSAKAGLAFSHLVVNEFEEAQAGFEEVLRKWPDYSEASALLALTLILGGKKDEAASHLAKLKDLEGPVADLAKQLLS